MRISISIKTLTLAGLVLVLSQLGFAQKVDLKIEGSSSVEGAIPGQMIEVFVAGISSQAGPPIPLDRFQVMVTQDGVHARSQSSLGCVGPYEPTSTIETTVIAGREDPGYK